LVRATPRSARCCWWISSAIVCAKARGLPPTRYTGGQRPTAASHAEQPHLDLDLGIDLLNRADDQAVRSQLQPAGERHVGKRSAAGIVP